MSNTLSVCMITKNEEKNISRCLESIKDIADEIIVVDTGSTDKTVEIANNYGAKVSFHKWNNDFSDARNESIKNATKDWILFLDADEELPKEEGLKLKELINNSNLEGFHCRLVNIIKNVNIGDSLVFRIFKNNPKYKFKGKIHEQIIPSIQKEKGKNTIGCSDIKILHYGYDPNVSSLELNHERNIKLLESYKEKDKDSYYYYCLGNEYARVNEYDKALGAYYRGYNPNIKASYMPYLCVNIAKTLFSCKRYNDEINKLYEFEKIYPDLRDLYFLEALAYVECSKFTNAKNAIMNYFSCDISNSIYPNSNFDSLYNIAELLTNVKKVCVQHKENLISALIIATKKNDNLINTIKSLNEICSEVIVITSKNSNIEKDVIKNLGAKIIESNSEDINKLLITGYKNCNCKYTLFIKPNEILSTKSQKQIISFLDSNPKVELFNLLVFNTINNSINSEFRLFKNNKNINNINDFNDFLKYTNNIEKTNTQIYIHSY